MRNAPLVPLLLGVGLCAAAWSLTGAVGDEGGPSTGAFHRDRERQPVEVLSDGGAAGRPARVEEGAARVVPRASAVVEGAEPPLARVRGTVVDAGGRPVSGAIVDLSTWTDDAWRAGVETSSLDDDRSGFRERTDAAGRFDFTVPVPTSDEVRLDVVPSAFLGELSRSFGPSDEPRLMQGDNDLGIMALEPAGIVTGRVLDEAGRPLADAWADFASSDWWSATVPCDASGRFEIERAPAGVGVVRAGAAGAFVASMEVVVRANVRTDVPDLLLAQAPTISGTVVDAAGRPLEGVYVHGQAVRWPWESCGAETDAGGRFRLTLEAVAAHKVFVTRSGGYGGWGSGGPESVFEPGEDAVRIVLEGAEPWRFRVLDAATGAPLEDFGIELLYGRDPSEHDVPLRHWPDGLVELDGWGYGVVVHADGFVSLVADVEAAASADVQELRLERGGTLVGRIVCDDGPLMGADVLLDADPLPPEPSPSDDQDHRGGGNPTFDLEGLAARERRTLTAQDGSFRFGGLASGTHRLRIAHRGRASRVVHGLRVERTSGLDVGDVAVSAPAVLRGRILPPPGFSPIGMRIRIDGGELDRAVHDPDGRFALDELAPGRHVVELDAYPDLLDSVVAEVELASGEAREVVLDARALAPCRVVVRVVRDGRPVPGVRIDTQEVREDWLSGPDELGVTGTDGVFRERMSPVTARRFVATGDAGFPLAWSALVTPPAGAELETTLTLETGTLVLVLPSGFVPPDGGVLFVKLSLEEGGDSTSWTRTWGSDGVTHADGVWKGERCEVGALGAGTYALTVSTWRCVGAGGTDDLCPSFEGDVTIRRGETTVVAVACSR